MRDPLVVYARGGEIQRGDLHIVAEDTSEEEDTSPVERLLLKAQQWRPSQHVKGVAADADDWYTVKSDGGPRPPAQGWQVVEDGAEAPPPMVVPVSVSSGAL